ncbi:hypothetical protein RSOLAG22IIIB_09066 [Rhizoctonia solani]|uniref:F-box domain-containing protein n=1 Tax=Rhizoctonia solani TaxID=456999 RepID=A0A0K6FX96_9AGAM|nr:hypothetical protein RSOLAG22IIIB_09066 [Rhizoctonia solani]
MTVVNLPLEVISQIGTCLSNRASDLALISLVSKSWWIGTLPALYRSVILKRNLHVKQFSAILSSGSVGSVQISSYVRELEIQLRDDDIDESVLVLLEPWVQRLSQLSKLRWNLFYIPKNLQLIQRFQKECPALRSVYIFIPGGIDFFESEDDPRHTALLGFTNLINFELEIDDFDAGFEDTCAWPLMTPLSNCPDLRSLTLWFHDDNIEYSLDDLVATWDELILPHLKELRIPGAVELSRKTLFSPPGEGSHPFRDFLTRHPQIEVLELGCSSSKIYDGEMNPCHFSLALPSLKYFGGPDFVADILVRSTVASQLETLIIEHCSFDPAANFLPDKVFNVQPLSNLRKPRIGTDDFDHALQILKAVIPETEVLEELTTTSVPHYYHRTFLGLLTHAPMLREFTMHNSMLLFQAMASNAGLPQIPIPGEEEEVPYKELFKKRMRVICPELKVINELRW